MAERPARMGSCDCPVYFGSGGTLLFAGGMFWVFVNPALYGPGYYLSTAGILVTGAAVLGTMWHGGLAEAKRSNQAPKPQLRPLAH
jgi:hypothetical protein